MAELVVSTLESIENQTSFLELLNANLSEIVDAVNQKLDRNDSDLGAMGVPLDMNSQRVMNLPSPESGSDAARWIDVYSASVVTEYAIPNVIGNEDKFLTTDGLILYWSDALTGLQPANNLNDVDDITDARANLGLGTAAVYDVGSSGTAVPLLSTANIWSSAQTWNGLATFAGGGNITGATEFRLQTTGLTTLSSDSLGYRGAPATVKDLDYTFVLDDAARAYFHSSASTHAWTIPPDASVAFPDGTGILVSNYGSGAVTITRGSGVTLRTNGSGTSANYTLPQYTTRTLFKIGANYWQVL